MVNLPMKDFRPRLALNSKNVQLIWNSAISYGFVSLSNNSSLRLSTKPAMARAQKPSALFDSFLDPLSPDNSGGLLACSRRDCIHLCGMSNIRPQTLCRRKHSGRLSWPRPCLSHLQTVHIVPTSRLESFIVLICSRTGDNNAFLKTTSSLAYCIGYSQQKNLWFFQVFLKTSKLFP